MSHIRIMIVILLNFCTYVRTFFVGAALLLAMGLPSQAQMGEGVLGWRWDGVYYATADEACRAQWNWSGMNNGYSRYIGAHPGESPVVKYCDWTSFQKLCPQETG